MAQRFWNRMAALGCLLLMVLIAPVVLWWALFPDRDDHDIRGFIGFCAKVAWTGRTGSCKR